MIFTFLGQSEGGLKSLEISSPSPKLNWDACKHACLNALGSQSTAWIAG